MIVPRIQLYHLLRATSTECVQVRSQEGKQPATKIILLFVLVAPANLIGSSSYHLPKTVIRDTPFGRTSKIKCASTLDPTTENESISMITYCWSCFSTFSHGQEYFQHQGSPPRPGSFVFYYLTLFLERGGFEVPAFPALVSLLLVFFLSSLASLHSLHIILIPNLTI